MTITAEQMNHRLMSLDEAREVLQESEPLTVIHTEPQQTEFQLDRAWWVGEEQLEDDQPVPAWIRVREREYQLTKEALLEATSTIGLPKAYVTKTPGSLVADHLNYWFSEPQTRASLMLRGGEPVVRGVGKASRQPFSNLTLLDRALDSIQARYGEGEVMVDRMTEHNLRSTRLKLVVPEARRAVREDDNWSGGILLRNSLVGEHATSVEGYLFRWWCTNGCITKQGSTGTYSRNADRETEIYDWMRMTTDGVLSQMESRFDEIQALTQMEVQGDVGRLIDRMAQSYRLSNTQREAVRNRMLEENDLTMYGLLNAVTAAATHDRGFARSARRGLMEMAGDMASDSGRCESCHQVTTPHGHN